LTVIHNKKSLTLMRYIDSLVRALSLMFMTVFWISSMKFLVS